MISNTSPTGRESTTGIKQHADYLKQFDQVDYDKFSDTDPLSSKAFTKDRSYTIKLPETLFSALRRSPDEFFQEMRLAAAVKWYELQLVSQAKAAEIAGISRYTFLEALSRFKVSPFQVTPEELLEEIARD